MVETKVRYAGGSDPGRVRRNNEDAWHADPERGIFFVVDGIGGQAAGEKAAEIAIDRLRARLERQTGAAEQRIREAITIANNEILRAARGNPEWQGMACVLTVAVLDNSSAVIGHVGDSRLYRIHRGTIEKITHDHSPVGEREDRRELSEEEAMRHPRRNEVYRDVGSEEHSPDDVDFIEIRRIAFEPDSALLLCSDGLSDQVPSRDIQGAVERNGGNPAQAVAELIDAANRAGGKDNVTIVLVEGDQFKAVPQGPAAALRKKKGKIPRAAGPLALLLLGALLTATGAYLSRQYWLPAPKVIEPRRLVVGRGQTYETIGAAVDAARVVDTVEILPGEYREQVKLKNGVQVKSITPLSAVLRAAPASAGPAVLAENISGARLSGVRIQGDAEAPLAAGIVLDHSDMEIEGVEIRGARVGIEIRGGRPSLTGSTITECAAEGVFLTNAARPWIAHNIFRVNKGKDVAAREDSRPILSDNLFDKIAVDLPAGESMDVVRQRNSFPPAPRGGRKQ